MTKPKGRTRPDPLATERDQLLADLERSYRVTGNPLYLWRALMLDWTETPLPGWIAGYLYGAARELWAIVADASNARPRRQTRVMEALGLKAMVIDDGQRRHEIATIKYSDNRHDRVKKLEDAFDALVGKRRDRDIAHHITLQRIAGTQHESARADAAEHFRVKRATVDRAWSKHSDRELMAAIGATTRPRRSKFASPPVTTAQAARKRSK